MGLFDFFLGNENKSGSTIKCEVDDIISTFEGGNIPLLQNKLFELYKKFNKPGGGRLITGYPEKDRLCEVFCLYLEYDWMHDSDLREVWAENGFYCIVEYFKSAQTKQDYVAAALNLFLVLEYGHDNLLPKFNDILNKAQYHPVHSQIFNSSEYAGGADYIIREFKFFAATILTPIVKMHPSVISPELRFAFNEAKTDFEFASVGPDQIISKMTFLSMIIGSILDDM